MSSFRKQVPVIRKTGYWDDAGDWHDNSPQNLTISMSVQPLTTEEMDALPEGRRTNRSVKIYSNIELLAAIQGTAQNSDVIVWLGKNYEVVGCTPYQMGVISHYKSYAVEVAAN